MVPQLVDRRQSKKLLEGENLASLLYVMNDFLYTQIERELRFFIKFGGEVNKRTELSAGFPS